MSLGCARCGDCCDERHLTLPYTRAQITAFAANPRIAGRMRRDLEFILGNWTQLTLYVDREGAVRSRWRCRRFDPDSRSCTAHSDRPPVCRDYPWYRTGPVPDKVHNLRCSYLLDLPPDQRPEGARPLIPLEVL